MDGSGSGSRKQSASSVNAGRPATTLEPKSHRYPSYIYAKARKGQDTTKADSSLEAMKLNKGTGKSKASNLSQANNG
jgi:hypothetical protein